MVHTHSFGEAQNNNEPAVSFPDISRITDPIVLIDDEVVRLLAFPLRPTQSTGLRVAFCDHKIYNLFFYRSKRSGSWPSILSANDAYMT